VVIHDPVYIEDGVTIERSVIGPNVSLEQGTKVADSSLRNAIVGRDARLTRVRLDGAMLGNAVVADGVAGSASLGDHSELTAARSD
jgi:glucose-1-phosphate thymidylyltransferase